MTLSFALAIAGLFAIVFALESSLSGSSPGIRPHSLMRWISSENWPAKVGAILIILGVGALLRYALLHLDAPDHLKLAGGILLGGATGALAYACREKPAQRALHFALTGTAFGIAYLCAYASFSLFNYVDDLPGIALLLTVAIVAAVYSANARAVSIAVLSMVGAYAAPAFALTPKGPLIVLGYYALVSLLACALVVARGWRPLIHLSFLFTLGGALFFGWTQGYYRPEHFDIMLPLLLVLVTIHLAMPLAEQRSMPSNWVLKLDTVYQILLPITAAVLIWSISPRLDPDAALGFGLLGGLWLIAAGFAWRFRRPVCAAHGLIGGLLVLAGVLIHFQNLSWPLIGLLGSSAYIIAGSRFKAFSGGQTLAGIVVLFCHILIVLDGQRFPAGTVPFLNLALVENALVVAALLGAGLTLWRRGGMLGLALLLAGALWGAVVLMNELLRLDIPQLPQLAHGLLILATIVLTLTLAAGPRRERALSACAGMLLLTSWWSSTGAVLWLAALLTVGTLAALLLVFQRRLTATDAARQAFPAEAFALPVAALLWGAALDRLLILPSIHFMFAVVAATMLFAVLLARAHAWRQPAFNDFLLPATFIGATLLLLFTYVSHIERGLWPVIAELLGLALLGAIASGIPDRQQAKLPMVTLAVLLALMLQAQVLRLFGPDGTLSIADILRLSWPAVVSLLWALMGATLAWTSQRLASRTVWSVGAALLAISAVKLIIFDFGSLGELENILALIAAGGVFMAVAWLAPLPPKAEPTTPSTPAAPAPAPAPQRTATRSVASTAKAETSTGWQSASLADVVAPPTTSVPVDSVTTPRPTPAEPTSPGRPPKSKAPALDFTWSAPRLLVFAIVGVALLIALFRYQSPRPSDNTRPIGPVQKALPTPTAPAAYRPPAPTVVTPPPAPVAIAEAPKLVTECDQFVARLPANYTLYAAGEYQGEKTNISIDDSGHAASRFTIQVNDSRHPVVLALGAYEPSVWTIQSAPGTEIAGVMVSGYHHQTIEGLPSDIPVLVSTYSNRSPCGHFYLRRENAQAADQALRRVFGRGATAYHVATGGRAVIGSPLPGNSADLPRSASPASYALAGEDGIAALIRAGKLRRAYPSDMPAGGTVSTQGASRSSRYAVERSYVVLDDITIPAGLFGAHAVTFIVPRGVPYPTGNKGHSTIIDLNKR